VNHKRPKGPEIHDVIDLQRPRGTVLTVEGPEAEKGKKTYVSHRKGRKGIEKRGRKN